MQQSPQMFGMPIQQQQQQQQQQPTAIISTEQIQKYLDENKQLIMAIMESQNLGKMNECAQYQAQLQKNLMYLAAIADAQPPAPTPTVPSQASASTLTGPSQPSASTLTGPSQPQPQSQPQPHFQPQMLMQPNFPQGPSMQPPQQAFTQQQTVPYGARMPFMSQPYDQQAHHMQHQQTMAGMMGMRMGGPTGLHPALQTGHATQAHFMDARNRQDGSEGGSGDGQGK